MDREECTNPYVKIYLRPPIDQKLRQTSVQPQTINPVWNEFFKFGVSSGTGFKTSRTLHFYIYNYAHSSRPSCIGEGQVRLTPLTIHNFNDFWCNISKQRAVRDQGLSIQTLPDDHCSPPRRMNISVNCWSRWPTWPKRSGWTWALSKLATSKRCPCIRKQVRREDPGWEWWKSSSSTRSCRSIDLTTRFYW